MVLQAERAVLAAPTAVVRRAGFMVAAAVESPLQTEPAVPVNRGPCASSGALAAVSLQLILETFNNHVDQP